MPACPALPSCLPAAITVVYLALSYSLLTAYCTKAAEVLDFFAGGGLPPLAGAAGFVGGVGGLLYLGGTRAADSLNQVPASAAAAAAAWPCCLLVGSCLLVASASMSLVFAQQAT